MFEVTGSGFVPGPWVAAPTPTQSTILFENANDWQVAIWNMNGNKVTGGGVVTPAVLDPSNWYAIGTGDFNDDSLPDIVWQNYGGRYDNSWPAITDTNGALIGGEVVIANPGPSWYAIGTGDFNDDSHSDILFQNANGQAAIWEMNGNTIIGGGAVDPNPGPSWQAVGAGDFNDDGHSDILWQNTNGQVTIWEMNGTNIVGGGTVSANPGPNWSAIGTAGQASSDILFQNTSGQTAIWHMNGTNIVGGGVVNPNPGPTWQAVGLA